MEVHPIAGVWVEIRAKRHTWGRSQVHPHTGCGLKSESKCTVIKVKRSSPCGGVGCNFAGYAKTKK